MIKKNPSSFFSSTAPAWEKNFNSIKKYLALTIAAIEDKNLEDAKKSEDMIYFILERTLEEKEIGNHFFDKFMIHIANLYSSYEKQETTLKFLDSLSEGCHKTRLLVTWSKNFESAKKYLNITISDVKNKKFPNAKENLEMLYFILERTEEGGDIALELLKNFMFYSENVEEKRLQKKENETDKQHFKKIMDEVNKKTMLCIEKNLKHEINLEKISSSNLIVKN